MGKRTTLFRKPGSASRAPTSTVLKTSAVGSRPGWPGSGWACFGRPKPEKKKRLRNNIWWCPSCVARSQISRENAVLGALVFTQFSQHFSGAQSSGDTPQHLDPPENPRQANPPEEALLADSVGSA